MNIRPLDYLRWHRIRSHRPIQASSFRFREPWCTRTDIRPQGSSSFRFMYTFRAWKDYLLCNPFLESPWEEILNLGFDSTKHIIFGKDLEFQHMVIGFLNLEKAKELLLRNQSNQIFLRLDWRGITRQQVTVEKFEVLQVHFSEVRYDIIQVPPVFLVQEFLAFNFDIVFQLL
jgi:hypothetical protein